ncbi:MAG: alpha/beta hydrolase [Planctomycetota bacterium]
MNVENTRILFRNSLLLPIIISVGWTPLGAGETPPSENSPTLFNFRLFFATGIQTAPFTGRVYVVVCEGTGEEPRNELRDWFHPPRVFAKDMKDVDPATTILIDPSADAFPEPLSKLPTASYRVQAIARRSLDHPVPGHGPGDLYSEPRTLILKPQNPGAIELTLNKEVAPSPFEESDRVKLIEIPSPMLSRFHHRDIKLRAAVVLPADWKPDGKESYPMLYFIPGFGGSHRMAHMIARSRKQNSPADKVLLCVPDPTCYYGHSVFTDSNTNGPWGRAFTEELIPEVERRFRAASKPQHRYVTGISSGGWSALWLQIAYPELFNGCWSHCPDPVDFRDFQRVDLYTDASNLFRESDGTRRPLARRKDEVTLYYQDFVQREAVLGPGGQIQSFEAVFSKRGPDGLPERFFDRKTGAINTTVAHTWEKYDINLILKRNWSTLGPKLAGKLHIFAGEKDTFYLEGAVRLLQQTLTELKSDAEVIIVPGMAHGIHMEAIEPMYQKILEEHRKTPE